MVDKQSILFNAPQSLNGPNIPWQITAEGHAIVARWKWMDARFFAPHEVNNETRAYTFTVVLNDNGTWREIDQTESKSSGVSFGGGGLKFGGSQQKFIGKTNQKSFQFGVGQNNQTGQAGFVVFKFDTSQVKQQIRTYLTYYGWRKA